MMPKNKDNSIINNLEKIFSMIESNSKFKRALDTTVDSLKKVYNESLNSKQLQSHSLDISNKKNNSKDNILLPPA